MQRPLAFSTDRGRGWQKARITLASGGRAAAAPFGRLRERRIGALAVVLVLAAVVYLWSASASGFPFDLGGSHGGDYFNLQTDAYVDGQLNLPVKPNPRLLALKDPLDPTQNAPFRGDVFDLSLYHDKLYLYWGPTPVLTLFLPWRVLPFGDFPPALATALFAWVGLLFSVLLLRFLVRRFLPETPTWMEVLAAVGLALCNIAPFILLRPAVYETSIAGGYAFALAALFFLLSGSLGATVSRRRLALGSLCIGLAAGSRPNMGLLILVAAGLWLWLVLSRQDIDWRERLRSAAVLLGPALVCFVALAIYNKARFDSFTEFGNRYQLNGTGVSTLGFGRLSWMPPGLYYFLVAPPRVTLAFPFIALPPPPGYPGTNPADYANPVEITGGVLTCFPIIILGLIALVLMLARRLAVPVQLKLGMAGLAGIGLIILAVTSYVLFGTTERYVMDFATPLLLVGFTGWFALRRFLSARVWPRRIVTVTGTVLALWGILVGAAIGVTGYSNAVAVNRPGTFKALEGFFSSLPTLATMIVDRPVVTRVANPLGYGSKVNYATFGTGLVSMAVGPKPAVVTITAPKDETVSIGGPMAPGVDARRGPVRLQELDAHGRVVAERPVTGGLTVFPVRLHRGINTIAFRAVGKPPRGLKPDDDPQLVQVTDLGFR